MLNVVLAAEENGKDTFSNREATGDQENSSFRSCEDFSVSEWIGTGSFCEVARCMDRVSGNEYAMKRVPKRKTGVDQACAMEAHCLRQMERSPLIVTLLWDFDTQHEWVGILELCQGGELWVKVKHCGCMLPGESAFYASQMVEALAAVHAAGIVHRDLKCENFMLTKTRDLKLIDFGTARDTTHPEVRPMLIGPQYEHHVGTPNFMSPEAVHGKANDRKSDLWSLGCSIYQLVVGAPPFSAPTHFLVLDKAQKGVLWWPPLGVSPQERDLISQLIQVDPDSRMAARTGQTKRVLSHALFAVVPPRPPAETPFSCGMRCVAKTIYMEGEAAIALDEKLANEANGSEDEMPMQLFGAAAMPAAAAPEIGEPTARLPAELPAAIAEAAGEVQCAAWPGHGGTIAEEDVSDEHVLLGLATEAAGACERGVYWLPGEACPVPVLELPEPVEGEKTKNVLATWRQVIEAFSTNETSPLPPSCCTLLLRFVAMAEQRRLQAHEVPDFGADSSEDEDEDLDEEGSEKAQGDIEKVAAGDEKEAVIAEGSTASSALVEPQSPNLDRAADELRAPGNVAAAGGPGSSSPEIGAKAGPEAEIKTVPQGTVRVVRGERKRCCSIV